MRERTREMEYYLWFAVHQPKTSMLCGAVSPGAALKNLLAIAKEYSPFKNNSSTDLLLSGKAAMKNS